MTTIQTTAAGEGAQTPDEAIGATLARLYAGADPSQPIAQRVAEVFAEAGMGDDPDLADVIRILERMPSDEVVSKMREAYASGSAIATTASVVLVALGGTALNVPIVGAVIAAVLVAASAITAFAGDLNARNDAEDFGRKTLERVGGVAALIIPMIDAEDAKTRLKGRQQLAAPIDAWVCCRLLELCAALANCYGARGMHGTLWTGAVGDVYTSESDWRKDPDHGKKRLPRAVNLTAPGFDGPFMARPTAIARPGFQRGIIHAIGGSEAFDYTRGAGAKSLRRAAACFAASIGIKAFIAQGRTPLERQGLFAALILAAEAITSGTSNVENWRLGESIWINETGRSLKGSIDALPADAAALVGTLPGALAAPGPYAGGVRFVFPARPAKLGLTLIAYRTAGRWQDGRREVAGAGAGILAPPVVPEVAITSDGQTPIAVWACRRNWDQRLFIGDVAESPTLANTYAEKAALPDPVLVWFGVPAGPVVEVDLPDDVWSAPSAALGPRCACSDPAAVKWLAAACTTNIPPPRDARRWWGDTVARALPVLALGVLDLAWGDDVALVTQEAADGSGGGGGIGPLLAAAAAAYVATR